LGNAPDAAGAETPETTSIELPIETLNIEESQVASAPESNSLDRWQHRLLPFMMYMIVGLAIFFFLTTFVQLWILHGRMADSPTLSGGELSSNGYEALTQLELYVVERRYHQANIFAMARVWVRYLGFVTGMALSLVGATFILGKMREPHTVTKGQVSAAQFSFAGSSPGIFLVFVGLVLMLSTIFFNRPIGVADGTTYVDGGVLLQWIQVMGANEGTANEGASWQPGSTAALGHEGEDTQPGSLVPVTSSVLAPPRSYPQNRRGSVPHSIE
jgi:hypothetical protein